MVELSLSFHRPKRLKVKSDGTLCCSLKTRKKIPIIFSHQHQARFLFLFLFLFKVLFTSHWTWLLFKHKIKKLNEHDKQKMIKWLKKVEEKQINSHPSYYILCALLSRIISYINTKELNKKIQKRRFGYQKNSQAPVVHKLSCRLLIL